MILYPVALMILTILFEMQVSSIFSNTTFKVFSDTLASGGIIKALCVPSGAKTYSNTSLKKGDIYKEAIKSGAKGLPFLKVLNDGNGSTLICNECKSLFGWANSFWLIFIFWFKNKCLKTLF